MYVHHIEVQRSLRRHRVGVWVCEGKEPSPATLICLCFRANTRTSLFYFLPSRAESFGKEKISGTVLQLGYRTISEDSKIVQKNLRHFSSSPLEYFGIKGSVSPKLAMNMTLADIFLATEF